MAKYLTNSNDINVNEVEDTDQINFELNDTTLFNKIYPVGSIYMSVNSTNPSTLFGGTWVAWGTGRVPVGVDTSQTEFNTVEKTGGSKELEAHSHEGVSSNYGGDISSFTVDGTDSVYDLGSLYQENKRKNSTMITGIAGTGHSGNLQPYITCYMWKRTA